MLIRTAEEGDLPVVLEIHRQAFGQKAEADLVREILVDPSARPVLSLLAEEDGRALGHILFSAAQLPPQGQKLRAALLAPLAVAPGAQGRGIGRRLVEDGLAELRRSGTDLVFVLGDPTFYGRFGFIPAIPLGLKAPFALPEGYLDAWRVKSLNDHLSGRPQGRVTCCDAVNKPELWQE